MPIHYTIEQGGFIWTKLCGFVSQEEYLEHPFQIADDPQIPFPLREIFDTREMTATDVMVADVEQAADPPPPLVELLRGSRIAVLAQIPVSFGLGRAFESLSAAIGFEVLITKHWDEALAFVASGKETPATPITAEEP